MDEIKLCEKCAPLLERSELDTFGRLRAKLCAHCRARVEYVRARARARDPEAQGHELALELARGPRLDALRKLIRVDWGTTRKP